MSRNITTGGKEGESNVEKVRKNVEKEQGWSNKGEEVSQEVMKEKGKRKTSEGG